MAQLQHLSRHLATVPLHLNTIFIELFIKMNNCLYCCMHCVMMFCNKAGARSCRNMQAWRVLYWKKALLWTLWLIIPDMLCWSADSKWAGADNAERDRSLRLWFMTVWVGVQTIVESVRSFPAGTVQQFGLLSAHGRDLWESLAGWEFVCAFLLLRVLLLFLRLRLDLPLFLFLLILRNFVQRREYVMKSVSSHSSCILDHVSVQAHFYCDFLSCLCVHGQTAVTHCPPLRWLCTPNFVCPIRFNLN